MPVTPTKASRDVSRIAKLIGVPLVLGGILAGIGYRLYCKRAQDSQGSEVLVPDGANVNDYVGSNQCAVCHPSIYEQQVQSRMFRSLTTVQEYQSINGSLPRGQFFDAVNAIRYSIEPQSDLVTVRATQGVRTAQAAMTYVLGSGVKGLTLVRELSDQELQEFRVSYYTDDHEWDFTPGQERLNTANIEETLGRRVSKAATDGCFRCHSTLLVQNAGRVVPDASKLGVSCERCHGPGRVHVETARRGEPVPPKNASIEQRVQDLLHQTSDTLTLRSAREMYMCGECHGLNETGAAPDDHDLAKMHVAALMSSNCYQQSKGELRCTDCHDPHSTSPRGDLKGFVAICLQCHVESSELAQADLGAATSNIKQADPPRAMRTCPVNAQSGCIECHMPVRQIRRGRFTHHRIAVRKDLGIAQPRPSRVGD